TRPDKYPGLRALIRSGALRAATPRGRSGAPVLRTRLGCHAGPRGPAWCHPCGVLPDSTCGSGFRPPAFHRFARVPQTANSSPYAVTAPPVHDSPDENTCQPEIVLPTLRPASPLSSITPGTPTFPGFKKIDGVRAGS